MTRTLNRSDRRADTPINLQADVVGRLTNWDRTRGLLWWPERLNDALMSRPIRDLQSVLQRTAKRLQMGKSLEIKVTGAPAG